MNHVFVLPGVNSSDPYQIYRFGVAMARARSDAGTDGITDKLPTWSAEAAFGEHAVVAGFNADVEPVIDQALKMAGLPAKKSTNKHTKQHRACVGESYQPCARLQRLPKVNKRLWQIHHHPMMTSPA